MADKKIYRITDDISFRQCDLANAEDTHRGDCTNFSDIVRNWTNYYYCMQKGIHFHCTRHPEIELEPIADNYQGLKLWCPKCGKVIDPGSQDELHSKCYRMLNIPEFKDAKLIRLDDWYFPEVKQKERTESGYWINTNVKTDKDGHTVIVIYVGHSDSNGKSQFFIKPEKLQLSHDHNDLDPATILSQIELTLKDRKIIQNYDD